MGHSNGSIYYSPSVHSLWDIKNSRVFTMRLTQEVIDKIAIAMQHTKMNGEVNWKDGDEIDVCLAGTFAGDKFISIINRTRSNTTKHVSTNAEKAIS